MPATRLTARQVVAQYHAAKRGMDIATGQWTNPRLSPREFFQWFNGCLTEKINAHCPARTGRNHSAEYNLALSRLRFYIENPRVIIEDDRVRGLPKRIAEALGDRLRSNNRD